MPKRVDENQPDIVAALRAVGAIVQHLHEVGGGCPDILVSHPRSVNNYLMEIKSARGKLTTRERDWHDEWRGQVAVVRSVDEALGVIGVEWE